MIQEMNCQSQYFPVDHIQSRGFEAKAKDSGRIGGKEGVKRWQGKAKLDEIRMPKLEGAKG